MKNNTSFLKTAEALKPELHKRTVSAYAKQTPMTQGDQTVLDFSEHLVGFVTLEFETVGSHPDAPVWLDLQFAEREQELTERVEEYHGWVSPSWVQQERIHLDTFPCSVTLPRRCAFRYLKISVLGISQRFRLGIAKAYCEAVSSADDARLLPYRSQDDELRLLDRIACRTLHDCMQEVFEDGPKRDRRLWLGDLR
ncbi:MAG: cellobiose phosphorylase, partial [Clostridia bacterium]|nr:cellobiose phosphorylase [Clostridia bacterium]